MKKINTFIVTVSAAIGLSVTGASAVEIADFADNLRVIPGNRAELLSSTPRELSQRVRKTAKTAKSGSHGKAAPTHRLPARSDAASELIYSCSFAFMTEGSETEPVAFELDDWDNIPEEIIGEENYGFGGQGIMQAGGAVYVPFEYQDDPDDPDWLVYGMLWTPDFSQAMKLVVELDAKTAPGSEYDTDELWVNASDYETTIADDGAEITTEWQHFTFNLDVSAFSPESEDDTYYLNVWALDGADILVKNIEIKGATTPLQVPVVAAYTDFTGSSFTANWSEVENATGYYLTVYDYDPVSNKATGVFLDQQYVEETHFNVTGLTPGQFYAYAVAATNGTYTTPLSTATRVCELMRPAGVKLTPAADYKSIEAAWDATPGANYYVLTGTSTHDVVPGQSIELANADFSSIESTGSVATPEESDFWYESRDELPGWQFSLGCSSPGAFGFMDNAYYTSLTGLSACLTSSDYDLSNIKDGTVSVEVEAASPGNGMLAGALSFDESTNKYAVASAYGTPDNVPQEFETYTFDLTGVSARTQFIFMTRAEENADGSLMIRSLKISAVAANDGSVVMPIGTVQTEKTTGTFKKPLEKDVKYSATVTPYLVDDNGYIIATGQPSEPETIIGDFSGITAPVDPSTECDTRYYNLQGQRVDRPAKGSVVIKVAGSKATKEIF